MKTTSFLTAILALGASIAAIACKDTSGATTNGGTSSTSSGGAGGLASATSSDSSSAVSSGSTTATSASASTSNSASSASAAASSGSSSSGGPSDFAARCAAPGVVRCVGFEAQSDIDGGFGAPHGTLPGDAVPALDTSQKASGASSLKFTLPASSGANAAGAYFTNLADDLSVQLDGGSKLFVQWRQRFSKELLAAVYAGGGGWKQAIVGAGDQPGCSANNAISIDNGGHCVSSCSALEVVTQNIGHRGFPAMYNSCTGSSSHGAYDAFEEPFGSSDFKIENARPSPFCLYSQGQSNPPKYFPPDGSCFGYAPDEWMTFQVEIDIGDRQGDEFKNSHVNLWAAREGSASEQVFDWGPYNLSAGDPALGLRYGKVWLLPYDTGKDASVAYPEAYTWYDDLIISTQPIADPL